MNIIGKDAVSRRISDIYAYLWVEKKRNVDTFDVKCAVEAVEKFFERRKVQLRAGFDYPPMTEREAIEKLLAAVQDYKLFLDAEEPTSLDSAAQTG